MTMGMLEKIYDLSPVWFQDLMCSVKGWKIKKRRFDRQFYEELAVFENRKYDGELQLSAIIQLASQVPAYSQVLRQRVGGVI